jgi:hypothetical protein
MAGIATTTGIIAIAGVDATMAGITAGENDRRRRGQPPRLYGNHRAARRFFCRSPRLERPNRDAHDSEGEPACLEKFLPQRCSPPRWRRHRRQPKPIGIIGIIITAAGIAGTGIIITGIRIIIIGTTIITLIIITGIIITRTTIGTGGITGIVIIGEKTRAAGRPAAALESPCPASRGRRDAIRLRGQRCFVLNGGSGRVHAGDAKSLCGSDD